MKHILRVFVLFLVLLAPATALATIGVLGSEHITEDFSGTAAGSVSVTFTATAGSSFAVFAGGIDATFATAISITCSDSKSQSYTSLDSGTLTNNYVTKSCVTANVASGSTTVTANFSISSSFFFVWVMEIGGAKTSPLDGHNVAIQSLGAGTDNATVSATNATQPALVIGFSIAEASAAAAAGTGFTSTTTGVSGQARSEYKRVTSATSQSATFSAGSSDDYSTHIVILDEASGGSPLPDAFWFGE